MVWFSLQKDVVHVQREELFPALVVKQLGGLMKRWRLLSLYMTDKQQNQTIISSRIKPNHLNCLGGQELHSFKELTTSN